MLCIRNSQISLMGRGCVGEQWMLCIHCNGCNVPFVQSQVFFTNHLLCFGLVSDTLLCTFMTAGYHTTALGCKYFSRVSISQDFWYKP